jgi:hypothetical protein
MALKYTKCLGKSYQNKKIHQITAKLSNGHKIYQVTEIYS